MVKDLKLQIKLLSKAGELLSVVNCFPGKVTVLRAYSPEQLEPFKNAVCGIPGKERIVITLDGNEFAPADHELIGFGDDLNTLPITVSDYLLDSGLPEAALDSILLSFALDSVKQSPLAKLTPCQHRRVRLLSATYQTERVVIINNPFEPMANEWRERFAELLLAYVDADQVPLLITSLEYRPNCWIDNKIVNRVQVGENSQRTIGFGSAPSEFEDLIKKVRENHQSTILSKQPVEPAKPVKPESVFPEMTLTKELDNTADLVKEQKKTKKTSAKAKTKNSPQAANLQSSRYGISKLFQHSSIRAITALSLLMIIAIVIFDKTIEDPNNETTTTPIELAQANNSNFTGDPNPPRSISNNHSETPEINQNNQTEVVAPAIDEPQIELPTNQEPRPEQAIIIPEQPVVNQPIVTAQLPDTIIHTPQPLDTTPDVESNIDQFPIQQAAIYVLDHYNPTLKKSILASFHGEESARAAHIQFAKLQTSSSRPTTTTAVKPKRDDQTFTRDLLKALKTTEGSGKGLPDSPSPEFNHSYASTTNSNPVVSQLENRDYQDLNRDERRTLLREKFREAIERAAQNRGD